MPISVACVCGKTFRVRDEVAGQMVTCQVCGASVLANAVAAVEPIASPGLIHAAAPKVPETDNISCPACAEAIPRKSIRCPFCKEALSTSLTDSQKNTVIKGVLQSLDSHSTAQDDDLRGGLLCLKTMILGGITFSFLVLFLYGIMAQNAEGAGVLGFIFGAGFGISFLVSLNNDYQAHHIQDSSSADTALKRFVGAIRTGRVKKAYAAIAPLSRNAHGVASIKFNNAKVAQNAGSSSYNDPKSYAKYWTTIFSGPSSVTRQVTLKSVKVERTTPEGIAIVEMRLGVISYSKLLYLTILLGLLICVILIYVLQARDEVVVRKAMIQHKGRWYILDGAISGDIDRAYT